MTPFLIAASVFVFFLLAGALWRFCFGGSRDYRP